MTKRSSARCLDHRLFELLSVHVPDSGVLIASVRFSDCERSIRLSPRHWLSSIADLVPTPPRPKRIRRARNEEPEPLVAAMQ